MRAKFWHEAHELCTNSAVALVKFARRSLVVGVRRASPICAPAAAPASVAGVAAATSPAAGANPFFLGLCCRERLGDQLARVSDPVKGDEAAHARALA